jgi:hypothetical protein
MLRARGERSLGDIRYEQGHNGEALVLYESSRSALRDLQSQKYGGKNLADELEMSTERLAGAKAGVGDLDGSLNDNLELLRNSAPCDEQAPPGRACRNLGYLLAGTGAQYASAGRPNLNEPAKAARLLEQAIHIQERFAALDPHDGQARYDLALRLGLLGDAWGTRIPGAPWRCTNGRSAWPRKWRRKIRLSGSRM